MNGSKKAGTKENKRINAETVYPYPVCKTAKGGNRYIAVYSCAVLKKNGIYVMVK